MTSAHLSRIGRGLRTAGPRSAVVDVPGMSGRATILLVALAYGAPTSFLSSQMRTAGIALSPRPDAKIGRKVLECLAILDQVITASEADYAERAASYAGTLSWAPAYRAYMVS